MKFILCSLLIGSGFAFCSDNLTVHPLYGSWKMKEIHYIESQQTHSQKDAFPGTFVFSEKRYVIMYNPWKTQRTPFKSLSKPTNEEIVSAFETLIFNSGSYTLTDNTISTRADIAKVPGFEGGQQFYHFTIEGDILDITMFDETYPNGDKPEWFGKLKVRFVLQKES